MDTFFQILIYHGEVRVVISHIDTPFLWECCIMKRGGNAPLVLDLSSESLRNAILDHVLMAALFKIVTKF